MLTSSPLFTADVFKKCALVALHSISEEGRVGEVGCHAPDPGNEWKMSCPKSPMWESEAWSEDESASSSASRESTVCNEALHVVRLHGSGVMLLRGLLSRHEIAFSHRGRAVKAKERVVVRGNRNGKEVWRVLVFGAGLLVSFFKFCLVRTPCAFLE